MGHATAKLAVEAWNRREPAQPGPKKVVCPNCTTEVVTVMIRKEDRGLGSVPNHYHYCQECKVRLEK